jgi:PAS domain S-box-containing protein
MMPDVADRLLDAFGQAVIVTLPDGIVVAWNPHAETLYGWTAAEAIGRDILELTPSSDSAAQAAELIERLRAGDSWCSGATTRASSPCATNQGS